MWKHISTVGHKIKRYLHVSIFSGLSFSNFVVSLSAPWNLGRFPVLLLLLRAIRCAFFDGPRLSNLFDRRHDPQIVDTIHSRGRSSWLLAALINSLHTIFLLNYFKITRKTRINSRKLGQKLLGARHFDILCTFAVMWHAINQNKEFVPWSPPAFITSLPLLTLVKLTWEICLGFIGHCKCPVDWFEHLNKDQLMDE